MDNLFAGTRTLTVTLLCFLLFAHTTRSAPTRRPREQSSGDETHLEPWQINMNICPAVLCPSFSGVASEPSTYQFFEGDIVLTNVTTAKMATPRSSARRKRAIIRPISKLWKYGIVPYVLDSSLTENARKYIGAAIRSFERETCLRFVPKTKDVEDYIMFINQPGCWSYVGKQGGEQYVSIGPGCDNFGTILHETSHALGFWHEQSRPDRDDFVKVITKNIPKQFISQFGKRNPEESSTRGYAYDYKSIMHYGDLYFSNSDKPTLKVIGIGRKMKFSIGQRKHLSEIDIAQLRAMYYCNLKDQRDRVCRDGWNKFENHCYKFVHDEMKTYAGARRYCEAEGGHLVHINTEKEDDYIKGYLINFYPDLTTWRTGAKRENDQFVWYLGGGKPSIQMNYTKWAPNQPGRYSTQVLVKFNGTPPRFVWKGSWAGTTKGDEESDAYPFICEAVPSVPCFKSATNDGRDYRGKLDYTSDGTTCQMWSSRYPQQHKFYTGDAAKDAANGIGDHNYCRNPNGRRAKPWCFVPLSPGSNKPRWQYCDVEICKS